MDIDKCYPPVRDMTSRFDVGLAIRGEYVTSQSVVMASASLSDPNLSPELCLPSEAGQEIAPQVPVRPEAMASSALR